MTRASHAGRSRGASDATPAKQSASVANRLMKLPESVLGNLGVDEELRDAIARARAVTSPIARRRAERTLAGDLRGVDLDALEATIANVQATGAAEPRLLHLAEQWRAAHRGGHRRRGRVSGRRRGPRCPR